MQEIINDNRYPNQFKTYTFSNYPKKEVYSEFTKSIKNNNIESSCYWGVELHCSGYLDELWEKLILISSQYINVSIPKIPSYIFNRYQDYLDLFNGDPTALHILNTRNDNDCRYKLAEIISLLATSNKRELTKLHNIKPYELNIEWIKSNKKLIDNMYIKPSFIRDGDSKEIHIIIYQFIQYISYSKKDIHNAIYWLSWLLEWDNKNKNNPLYKIENRKVKGIEDKFQHDIIWLLWEAILTETNDRNIESLSTQIKCLYQLYKFKFNASKKKTKIPLLIHSITLLTLNIDWTLPLTNKQDIIKNVCVQINKLYMDLNGCAVCCDVLTQNPSDMTIQYNNNQQINNNQPTRTTKSSTNNMTQKSNKKINISDDSIKKMEEFNRISNLMLYQ